MHFEGDVAKHVVVIAHKYPPFNGVGANRWYHLSNELAVMGYKVHLVTVERGGVVPIHKNITIHKVDSDSFYKLSAFSFSNRYVNSVYKRIIDGLRSMFWYDDEAQYWGSGLFAKIKQLKSIYNIKTIIATGHPFQVNRWASELKKKYDSDIYLIQDFRDPWYDNPFKTYLFQWQKEKVKKWQDEAISVSDINVFVTKGLMELISPSNKSVVIENGHYFSNYERHYTDRRNNEIIIHAGTLANGRDVVAEPFFKLCQNSPEILNGKLVHFYGRVSLWLLKKYKKLFSSGLFVLHNSIKQDELIEVYSKSIFALQFNAEEYPYLVSTKIYEHPVFGLPTLSVNCGGEIDELIKSCNLGVSCRPNCSSILKGMETLFEIKISKELSDFANSSSFKRRAERFSELIQ